MPKVLEAPEELLYQVLIKTIEIDNLSNAIIRESLGLGLKFAENPENLPINLDKIYRFNNHFLINLGSSTRAKLLIEVFLDNKIEYDRKFKYKMINFYKIRNIFAHKSYPADLEGNTIFDPQQWVKLNEQHQILHKQLKELLDKVPRENFK